MNILIKTGLAACVFAVTVVAAAPVNANTLWEELNETAPLSQSHGELTAPRSLFDDIDDTAPIYAAKRDFVGEWFVQRRIL